MHGNATGAAAEPEEGKRPLDDSTIIVPHEEFALANGKRVVVKPWGMTKGKLVLARLDALKPKLFEPDETGAIDPKRILDRAWDEMVDLVSLSTDVPRSEMEADLSEGGWTFEDILRGTDTVFRVCILRADGTGALPLLLTLVTEMTELVARSLGPVIARRHSNASAQKGPSTDESGNGSG